MLDLKNILNNFDNVKQKLASRNFDVSVLDKIKEVAQKRSKLMTKLQSLEAKRNQLSKEFGKAKAKGDSAIDILAKVSKVKKEIWVIKDSEININKEIKKLLLIVPNLPNKNTPTGKDENANLVINEYPNLGRQKVTDVKPHYEIALELDIVDFERAVKLSGTRFWAYKGLGAKLVRSLESFMLDIHIKKGYIEIVPPVLVKSKIMEGTGQLPKFSEDLFKIENEDKWLIPTAEVPLTNFYSNEILDLTKPIALTAYTPCFRKEAGSGGKDTKGLIRAHQFNKVELVKLVKNEDLQLEFNKTINDAKHILELLELPYRELRLCTGDIGFSVEETIDLEVWMPSENRYREISSISAYGNFQARRANIRYKDENGKKYIANTINGSGLAIDRTIAAILENYQNKDGTIDIPKALIKYMGYEKIG